MRSGRTTAIINNDPSGCGRRNTEPRGCPPIGPVGGPQQGRSAARQQGRVSSPPTGPLQIARARAEGLATSSGHSLTQRKTDRPPRQSTAAVALPAAVARAPAHKRVVVARQAAPREAPPREAPPREVVAGAEPLALVTSNFLACLHTWFWCESIARWAPDGRALTWIKDSGGFQVPGRAAIRPGHAAGRATRRLGRLSCGSQDHSAEVLKRTPSRPHSTNCAGSTTRHHRAGYQEPAQHNRHVGAYRCVLGR